MNERWWLRAEGSELPGELRDDRVCDWMQPGAGRQVLSSDRQSAAVRFDLQPPLLVKWRRPLSRRTRRTFLRASRERREARVALAAAKRGIDTPAPWAVGELRGRGLLLGSVLVRRFDPSAETAAERARQDPSILREVAIALRDWHDRGFRHGDCYPKNVLVGGNAVRPRPIGFPAGGFVRAGAVVDRARLKDLAQFAAGCQALAPDEDPFAFLEPYADCADGLPAVAQLRQEATPAFERVMARKAERVATQAEREPDGPPPPLPLPPDFGRGAKVRVRPLSDLG